MFVGVCVCICFGLLFCVTAITEFYTLSLHDALPISATQRLRAPTRPPRRSPRSIARLRDRRRERAVPDRKSTRLNSSHEWTSYAVFCLKKKKGKLHS